MSAGSAVLARATLRKGSLDLIKKMLWMAVSDALHRAAVRIEELQHSDASQVPIDTGRLRGSFKLAISPGQIIMHWSAIDKGFDYAHVVDVGIPGTRYYGRHYSDVMKDQSKQIVHEELLLAMKRHMP